LSGGGYGEADDDIDVYDVGDTGCGVEYVDNGDVGYTIVGTDDDDATAYGNYDDVADDDDVDDDDYDDDAYDDDADDDAADDVYGYGVDGDDACFCDTDDVDGNSGGYTACYDGDGDGVDGADEYDCKYDDDDEYAGDHYDDGVVDDGGGYSDGDGVGDLYYGVDDEDDATSAAKADRADEVIVGDVVDIVVNHDGDIGCDALY